MEMCSLLRRADGRATGRTEKKAEDGRRQETGVRTNSFAQRLPAIEGCDGTYHLTSVRDSFLGHICSNVSGLICHCERMLARMDRCTDDLTLTWPETSVEGWNLRVRAVSGRHRQRARACRRTF